MKKLKIYTKKTIRKRQSSFSYKLGTPLKSLAKTQAALFGAGATLNITKKI